MGGRGLPRRQKHLLRPLSKFPEVLPCGLCHQHLCLSPPLNGPPVQTPSQRPMELTLVRKAQVL